MAFQPGAFGPTRDGLEYVGTTAGTEERVKKLLLEHQVHRD